MTVKLCVDWSRMVYLPMEVRIWFWSLAAWPPTFLFLSFSALYSSFLWRTKCINPPPPLALPLETIHLCFHFAAYREREAASRRKKKVDGKETAGWTGKSQNQSSGNNLDNILQCQDTSFLKKWWIFNFLNYQVVLEDIVLLLLYHQFKKDNVHNLK